MDVQTFYNKGPHPLLLAGSRAARGKKKWYTNSLNECVLFILFTYFTNVVADCIIQRGKMHGARGSRVGDT